LFASPTRVGAVAGGVTTTAAAGVTANGVYNFSNDLEKAFSSKGADTEGSGESEYASTYKKRLDQTPTDSADGEWVGYRGESTYG
jgi:hypothetical protein